MQTLTEQRIDKWLWAARFFKTRALAVEAIKNGKVSINGVRPKPARQLQLGDCVVVRKDQYEFELEVVGLNEQRRPAKEAVLLYQETEASQHKRSETAEQLKLARSSYQPAAGKPDRRGREAIRKMRRGG